MRENYTKNLPAKFVRNICGLHGAKGEKWLADLPAVVGATLEKWSLKIDRVFPNLTFNFVAACFDENGEKFVLKISVPEKDSSLIYEYKALQIFDGKGAVKVLKFNEKLGAMLLERAVEGETLHEVCGEDYEKAVEIAVSVMSELPRNPPNKTDFINLDVWKNGLNRAAEANFQIEKVVKARKFFSELAEPFGNKILLHGDIHFDNILSAKREPFLLIDPKGIVGEIGYEIAVFLNDLADWTEHLPNRKEILDFAVEKFSKAFNVNDESIQKWCYAFAVLSAWWMMEDFGENRPKDVLRAEVWQV